MKIEKKCWPELFNLVIKGEKNFDIRINDFSIKEGDTLVLKEWDPKTKNYTRRMSEKKVSTVIKTKDLNFFNKEDIIKYGYQVIGF